MTETRVPNAQSLVARVRQRLCSDSVRHRLESVERLEQMRARIRQECGELPDSTPGIREERDQRG